MKRGLLIGVGTLGGLGAVMAITPPQFGTGAGTIGTLSGQSLGGTTSTPAATPTPTPSAVTSSGEDDGGGTATKIPTTKATSAAKSAAAKKAAAAKAAAAAKKAAASVGTPTPAPTKSATTSTSGASGTFVGSTSQTRFGPVQVEVVVVNGKITSAKALQYPNNDPRSSNISSQAIPLLVQETLAANSSSIQGVGGASYTSYGWYQSLQSALAKAGMK